MRSNSYAVLTALLCTFAASPAFGAASLTPLGDLAGGNFSSQANGVSADGLVVVGDAHSASGIQAFRWTAGSGMIGLGDLSGGTFQSQARGVSGDGSVVVGGGNSASGPEAFRWTAATGMVGLGDLPGGNFESEAHAVSADGAIVVGKSSSTTSGVLVEAFRWTADSGMVGLGYRPTGHGYPTSLAAGVSASGSVVVGQVSMGDYEAFRWTASSGLVGLGDLPGGMFQSQAHGVSGDGLVVVGVGFSASTNEAFRWTESSGMLGLGQLPGGQLSFATAVNHDGSVIVGRDYTVFEALRWSAASGMERLWDVLLQNGLDPAADGWTSLFDARGISADGTTIVGSGIRNGNAEAFVAVVPQLSSLGGDNNQDGVVDAADYVLWRKNDGTQLGFDTWRANFGATRGNGVGGSVSRNAVPEASSLVLLTLAACALLRRRDQFRPRLCAQS